MEYYITSYLIVSLHFLKNTFRVGSAKAGHLLENALGHFKAITNSLTNFVCAEQHNRLFLTCLC